MSKLIRVLLYPFIIVFALIIISPKEQGFYYLEDFLQKQKVIISDEKISDLGILFKLQNSTFYYDSIKAGSAREVSVVIALLYNRVTLQNFAIHPDFKDFFPGDIEKIEAKHIFYKPHIVELSGNGAFGKLSGEVNLFERKLRVILFASSEMSRKYRQLLRGFKKTKEGYIYEQQF